MSDGQTFVLYFLKVPRMILDFSNELNLIQASGVFNFCFISSFMIFYGTTQETHLNRTIRKVLSYRGGLYLIMQVSISSKTISPPPRDKPLGHDLKGVKTLPQGQSLFTKTLPSRQNRESKAPPPGHKVRKCHKQIYKL